MSDGPLKEDHIRRFFEAKGVSFKCAACGHDQFECFDEYEEGARFVLIAMKYPYTDISQAQVSEVVHLECSKCHAIQLYNRKPLTAWVAENIEESDED